MTPIQRAAVLVFLCCTSSVVGEYQHEKENAQDLPLRDEAEQGLLKDSAGRLGRLFSAMIEDRDTWREEWGSTTPEWSEWDESRKLEVQEKLKLREEEGGQVEVNLREAKDSEKTTAKVVNDTEKIRQEESERARAEEAQRLTEEKEREKRLKQAEEREKQEEEVKKMMKEAEKEREEERKREEAEEEAERRRAEEEQKRLEEEERARKEEVLRQEEENRRREEEEAEKKRAAEREDAEERRKASQKTELPLRQEEGGGKKQEEGSNFLDLRSSKEENDEGQASSKEEKHEGSGGKVELPLRDEETPSLRSGETLPLRGEATPLKETVCEVKEEEGGAGGRGGMGLREPEREGVDAILEGAGREKAQGEEAQREGAQHQGVHREEERRRTDQALKDMLTGERSRTGPRARKRAGVSEFACFQASSLAGYFFYYLVFHRAHASLTPVVPSRGLLTPAALTLAWSLSSALQYHLNTAVGRLFQAPPRFSFKTSLLISAIGTVSAPGIARLWVLSGLEGSYCFLATAGTWALYYNLLWLS